MWHKFKPVLLSLLTLALVFPFESLMADDAKVLPQGRFRIRYVSGFTQTENNFDEGGNIGAIGSGFTRSLDSQLLQALNPQTTELIKILNATQPGLGDNLTVAELNTEVDSFFMTNVLAAEYGLTERISVGAILPIVYGNVSVRATSNPNPEFEALTASLPDGHPLKTQLNQVKESMTADGLNSILQNQLNYSEGLNTWSGTGLGDLEVGAKYNYYKTPELRMTAKAGARIPTGRVDDPNLLFDVGFGDGQFDVGAYHYIDYQFTADAYATFEVGYTSQLPHEATFRAVLSEDLPLGSTNAKLDRNLGDYWEAAIDANYTFLTYLSASARYHFKQKFKDTYTGNNQVNLAALEANTNAMVHDVSAQLEFSNLPAVMDGTASIPFAVSAFYSQPIAGKNVSDVRTTGLQVKSYF